MKKIHTFEDTLETLLFDAGLSEKESRVYRVLLEKGTLPVPGIVKLSGLKKGITYTILYKLTHEELLTQFEKAGKLYFQVNPPEMLITLVERKKKIMEDVADRVDKIIPQLQSQYKLAVGKPIIQYFEGVEGIKKVYEDTLKEGKHIYAILQTAEVNDQIYTWLNSVYLKTRVRLQIPAQVIVASGQWAAEYRKMDKKSLRETVVVPSHQFPFQHEVDIYGDKVAFINYKKGEALIGIIIKHPQIAQTMKALFDLAWVGARERR